MIVEDHEESRDFITIKQKDYILRHAKRRRPYRPQAEYEAPLNALSGPYREHLRTRRKNNSLPTDEQSEDPEGYLSRLRRECRHLKGFLPETLPDEDLIEREEGKVRKTVYQVDYFKEGFTFPHTKYVSLPEDWIVPETIQKRSYRNPSKVVDAKLLHPQRNTKPPNHLDPNKKEQEARRVTTGESEYDGTINTVGDRILRKFRISPMPKESSSNLQASAMPDLDCAKILSSKYPSIPSKVI